MCQSHRPEGEEQKEPAVVERGLEDSDQVHRAHRLHGLRRNLDRVHTTEPVQERNKHAGGRHYSTRPAGSDFREVLRPVAVDSVQDPGLCD